jgi:hypothetical protein
MRAQNPLMDVETPTRGQDRDGGIVPRRRRKFPLEELWWTYY